MADKRNAGEVSGFDVVRAVKHVRSHPGSASPPPPPRPPKAPPSAAPEPPEDRKPAAGARIGKTAVPTKYEFVCYECGYRFTVAGKVHTLYCAKCRTILNQTDYTIEKRHDVSIVTAGKVTITPEGVWAGGGLTARDVIIEGRHEGGSIKVYHRLEIGPGAEFDLGQIEAEDLVVREGATVDGGGRDLKYRNVIIRGDVHGSLEAAGLVSLHVGGSFRGRLKTKRLIMEDGAVLEADVEIGGDGVEPAPLAGQA